MNANQFFNKVTNSKEDIVFKFINLLDIKRLVEKYPKLKLLIPSELLKI